MSAFSRERSSDLARGAEATLGRLRDQLRRRAPALGAAGPEDPSWVLLEVLAEALEELRGDADRLEERLLPRLLESLGEESRRGTAAHGAVLLGAAAPGGEPVLVPAGTVVVAPRREGEPRLAFETVADTWTSEAQLLRVVASGGAVPQEILCHPQVGWDGEPVPLFGGRTCLLRHLHLGDSALSRLVRPGSRLLLEWPGVPQVLWDGAWEHSVAGGWRAVRVALEETRGPGVKRGTRLVLEGPLPDLAPATIEGATVPWLRLTLPADRKTSFLPPRWTSFEPTGGRESLPRPVARILSHGGGRWEDHSLTPEKLAPAEASADADPAVFLGWDRLAAGAVYWSLDGITVPPEWSALQGARAPRLEWEHTSGRGFRALAVRDGTRALTRSGGWSWELPRDWTAQELHGEKLFWLRARWSGGEHCRAPRVRAVIPHAAAVVERTRRRDVVLELPVDRRGRALLELEGAEVERLDAIELAGETAGAWLRLLSGERPGPAAFSLRRRPRGGFLLEGPFRPDAPATIRAPEILLHHGSRGNLPAGTPCVLEREIAGLARSLPLLALEGGADGESPEAFRRRLAATWRTGERAVTAGDYRRLAMALEPEIGRVEVSVRPEAPWRLIVCVLPSAASGPGAFAPARLRWLEEQLQEMAPLGTVVEVTEPAYVPFHVVARMPERDAIPGEALRRRLEERLRRAFDPLRGGPNGLGAPLGRWPTEDGIRAIALRVGAAGSEAAPVVPEAQEDEAKRWRFQVRPAEDALAAGLEEAADGAIAPWLLPVMGRLTLEHPGT